MGLADFLLARIAEDEEVAVKAGRAWCRNWEAEVSATAYGWRNSRLGADPSVCMVVTGDEHGSHMLMSPWDAETDAVVVEHAARHDPARVLAECDARRRIVEHSRAATEEHKRAVREAPVVATPGRALRQGEDQTWWAALRLLALPYADHPAYREEWKP